MAVLIQGPKGENPPEYTPDDHFVVAEGNVPVL